MIIRITTPIGKFEVDYEKRMDDKIDDLHTLIKDAAKGDCKYLSLDNNTVSVVLGKDVLTASVFQIIL